MKRVGCNQRLQLESLILSINDSFNESKITTLRFLVELVEITIRFKNLRFSLSFAKKEAGGCKNPL